MTAISSLRLHAVQTAVRPAAQINRSVSGIDFAQLVDSDGANTSTAAPVDPLPRGGDTGSLREPGILPAVGAREPGRHPTVGAREPGTVPSSQGGREPDSPAPRAAREPDHLPSRASDPISRKIVREPDLQRPKIQFAVEPYPFRESSVEPHLRAAIPTASTRARDI